MIPFVLKARLKLQPPVLYVCIDTLIGQMSICTVKCI